ncbi:MAG: glycosyltransferase [Lachnospiraceae bacterium]|nr:glycosyltransferase [Lachnospiraceae bacterium]HBV83395.1 hypothetical protein [Lachnospiraceae bacterium]
MKKILFCITRLNGGGAERALSNLTLAMPDEIQIDILVNCEESEKDYEHRGNVISIANVDKRLFRIPFPLKVLVGRYYNLWRLKKNGNYDACISFMDDSNIANILTGNQHCKVILSERSTLSETALSKKKKWFAKKKYKKADKIVSLSKGVEYDLYKNFDVPLDRLTTIYNGYDSESIRIKAQEIPDIEFDSQCLYFLNMGRFEEVKGQWHLIRAFAEVEKKYPQSRLIICGQGPYMGMLKEMVADYHIQDKVLFLGFVKNPYAISKRCDAFVFSSLWEGLANVVIESMICGLPIITTDYRYGAREILAPDTDYKFQLKDGIEFAKYGIITPVCSGKKYSSQEPLEKAERFLMEAMIKMIEDKVLRKHYSEEALKRAEDFAIDKKVRQWLELLD